MEIYHNPRCTQSRAGLQYLEENGYHGEVRNYMKDGITEEEIRMILEKSGLSAFDLVRTNDSLYKERYKGQKLSQDQWSAILSENPRLL